MNPIYRILETFEKKQDIEEVLDAWVVLEAPETKIAEWCNELSQEEKARLSHRLQKLQDVLQRAQEKKAAELVNLKEQIVVARSVKPANLAYLKASSYTKKLTN